MRHAHAIAPYRAPWPETRRAAQLGRQAIAQLEAALAAQ